MNVKVGFVIPWYGEGISGGAESECRAVVKSLLNAGWSAEVLTTCVKSFQSDWNLDFHPEGEGLEDSVPVKRFRVRQRDTAKFDQVNYKLMHAQSVSSAEEDTFVQEMVNSPGLYEFIAAHQSEYVFVFMPYMFGTTYAGSRICPERSILIPCLHDESYARMEVFRRMFESVRGLIFNSEPEKVLAQNLYRLDSKRLAVLGSPVNSGWTGSAERFRAKYHLADFFLYAGRTEKGKGADILLDYFCRYLDETGRSESLVFIGGGDLEIPDSHASRIVKLGFVPTQDKYDAYAAAIALCVPSVMESFSLVTMESWLAGRPVVVNGRCPVTRGFCIGSNAGLYFDNYDEFREILLLLSTNFGLSRKLGENGREYVLRNFHPDAMAAKYASALAEWGFPPARIEAKEES